MHIFLGVSRNFFKKHIFADRLLLRTPQPVSPNNIVKKENGVQKCRTSNVFPIEDHGTFVPKFGEDNF